MIVLEVYQHPPQSLMVLHGSHYTIAAEHMAQNLRQATYLGDGDEGLCHWLVLSGFTLLPPFDLIVASLS